MYVIVYAFFHSPPDVDEVSFSFLPHNNADWDVTYRCSPRYFFTATVVSLHAVCVSVCVSPTVLEKSEFKDESQFFRFYADEEMEGTSTKSKQLQRNDFKLIENILVKSLVVSWNTHQLITHAWLIRLVTVGLTS